MTACSTATSNATGSSPTPLGSLATPARSLAPQRAEGRGRRPRDAGPSLLLTYSTSASSNSGEPVLRRWC